MPPSIFRTSDFSNQFPFPLACVAGVNREGEGEREKNGALRARDEGTPATKIPIFSSPPTDFYVIQLS